MSRKDITPTLLKKLYLKKFLSKKEIALLLHCNITTIHKKIIKFGIPARKQSEAVKIAMQKQIIKIPKHQLKNLYLKQKLSIGEVAQKMHYCRETIERELKRYKIPLRKKSEAISLGWRKKRIKKSTIAKFYYKDYLTQEQIAKKLGKNRATILRLMQEYRLKTRKKSEFATHYPKFNFSGNSEEKAYLIGFRTGDLYVQLSPSKKLIIVGTTSTKIEQINLFKNLFRNYGHVWIGKQRKDGNRVFVVSLNRTFDFLLPKQDNIPKWIRDNKDYFLSFLAGYTDAEGCIHIGNNNVALLKISSYDKKTLKQIYEQLFKIGIGCNPPRIRVKKGFRKSDGCVYRNDEWSFVITKKCSLLPLLQLLEPRLKHAKRLRDLKKAKQNIINRNQRNLPENASLKYLPV